MNHSPHRTGLPVCVIGAGVSGLAAAKYLHQASIPFDCIDERQSVGGIWAYTEQPGITCAWRTLNQNSPRGTYDYSDFPMPDHYADFPSAAEVSDYLNAYVDHFGFRNRLRLGRRVERVEPRADGSWDVTLDDGETRRYGAVVVANGHHHDPRYPDYAADFTGEALHSQDYRHRERFLGKRVLVVGLGNSASQIAVDVSHAAEHTLLSVRRGAWILPHFVRGKPYNAWVNPPPWWVYRFVPDALLYPAVSLYVRLLLGRPDQHGLPKPDHHFGQALPTICEGIHDRIGYGRLSIKPAVSKIEDRRVTFADGSEAVVDAIIYGTGYHTTFPFLDRRIFAADENRVRLYKRTFLPGYPTLCFVGAFQAIGPSFVPVYEAQARLVAAYLAGDYALPSPAEMERDIERDLRQIERTFVRSPRNNYQVNLPVFIHDCAVELKRGRRRVAKGAPSFSPAPLTDPAEQGEPAPVGSGDMAGPGR